MSVAALDDIRAGVDVIWEPGAVYELRIPIRVNRVVSGYYDDPERFVVDAARWSGKAPGVYQTLNSVNPSLIARSANHLTDYATATTKDGDILRRRWLPLDFDPVRPAGISSSNEEHDAAIERAQAAARWLVDIGIPKDAIVSADSGNGAHLLVRIDMENTDEARDLIQQCTAAVALHFEDERVHVDMTTYNASRIWKVYGTIAGKGESIPARPHRHAHFRRVGSFQR